MKNVKNTRTNDTIYNGVVYMYTNKFNGKKYIGETICEAKRKTKHKYDTFKRNSKLYFHRSLRKCGYDNFDYEVLFKFSHHNKQSVKNVLWDKEVELIKEYNTFGEGGYNLTSGGGGTYGSKRTDEFKKRHSKLMMGKNKGNKATLGRKNTPEQSKRQSIRQKGRKMTITPEGLAKKRATIIKYHSKPIIQYDLQGNEIAKHPSTIEASKTIGVNRVGIKDCLGGRQKTAYGFIWKFDKQ